MNPTKQGLKPGNTLTCTYLLFVLAHESNKTRIETLPDSFGCICCRKVLAHESNKTRIETQTLQNILAGEAGLSPWIQQNKDWNVPLCNIHDNPRSRLSPWIQQNKDWNLGQTIATLFLPQVLAHESNKTRIETGILANSPAVCC